MTSKKLFIIYGGPSSEREVSFSSKDYFLNLYKDKKPILVEWLVNFDFVIDKKIYKENDFYEYLAKQNCIAIIAGHGEYIEDGYIQEKLALHKIPFTGSTASSCKLSMDKYESQNIAKNFTNIIPTYKTAIKNFDLEIFNKYIKSFPIFMKPNDKGSSIGCFLIKSQDELRTKIKELNANEVYIFQPKIYGTEISIGTVRTKDGFLDLPTTEILPKISEFFDYKAKYSDSGSEEITPARLDQDLNKKITDLANKIHDTLELGYYSRSDFIVDSNDEIYYLETNAYPGMSKNSILPKELAHAKLVDQFKNGLLEQIQTPIKQNRVILGVPYQSQFTLTENNNIARDANWSIPENGYEISGAKNMEDYKFYSDKICGSACIKMLLEYYKKERKTLFEIFYDLAGANLYTMHWELNYSDLNNFSQKYNLKAKTYRVGLTIDEICISLQKNIPVVISVNTLNSTKEKAYKGGHLVVVTGFDLTKNELYINDPSGDNKKNLCINAPLPFEKYYGVSSGRGFTIYE